MFKSLACFFLVAVAVSNGYIINDAVNEGSNVNSVNSDVTQTGIQNIGVGGPIGGPIWYSGASSVIPVIGGASSVLPLIGGPSSLLYKLPVAQYAPLAHRIPHLGYPRWGYPASIVSDASNVGTNIGSTGSHVHQDNIQNINQGYGYYALV